MRSTLRPRFTGSVPEGIAGSCCGLSEECFELGEYHLDRVEIWGVARQIDQAGAAVIDCLAHAGDLAAAEIIQDDIVAWHKRRREHLLDVGAEKLAVHVAACRLGRGSRCSPEMSIVRSPTANDAKTGPGLNASRQGDVRLS